jgi:hypothetical protein
VTRLPKIHYESYGVALVGSESLDAVEQKPKWCLFCYETASVEGQGRLIF